MDLFIQAPNHLGDGVMALPAITALCAWAQRAWVSSPRWGQVLYRDTGATWSPVGASLPAVDAALLLGPSFRSAWRVRRVRRRIGLHADGRWPLLTDALIPSGAHRAVDYERIAAVLGVVVEGAPRFGSRSAERTAYAGEPWYWAINPVSRSGSVVQWRGYTELLRRLPGEVRVLAGPGEAALLDSLLGSGVPAGVRRMVGLGLGELAGALQRCRGLVSNDSGIAHFAAACGVPVVVIHGSTTAARTGAAGAVPVEGAALPCRPCYRKRCPRPLGSMGGPPCLDVSVDRVLEAALAADRASSPGGGP